MLRALAIAGIAVALSGCMTGAVQRLTPEQMHTLITDFHNAGCGGRIDVKLGAAAGGLGGEAHSSLDMAGECPIGDIPKRPAR